VLVVAVAFSLHTLQQRQLRDYEKVYCNRVGTTDVQWAALAAEMLME
jgi:hypothetical protein